MQNGVSHVLVVEDDESTCELIKACLETGGYRVEVAGDGSRAIALVDKLEYHLILLDVLLPGVAGLDVLRHIRRGSDVPVLMLTALHGEDSKLNAFEDGADDYLTKPFHPRELLARLAAVSRRRAEFGRSLVEVGDLVLDTGRRTVTRRGEVVKLSEIEFDLLSILVRSYERLVQNEFLELALRRLNHPSPEHAISPAINRLRKQLGPRPAGQERIITVRGRGYLYTDRSLL